MLKPVFADIKYGMKRVVTQEEIEEAAKVANAHQFIMEQQDGYNTMVLTSFPCCNNC